MLPCLARDCQVHSGKGRDRVGTRELGGFLLALSWNMTPDGWERMGAKPVVSSNAQDI